MKKLTIGLAAIALLGAACASSEQKAQGSEDVLRLGIDDARNAVALGQFVAERRLRKM